MPVFKKGSSNGHKSNVLLKKRASPDRQLTKAQLNERNRRIIKDREANGG